MNSIRTIAFLGIVSVLIGIYYSSSSESGIDIDNEVFNMQVAPIKAFVLGATGTVGKAIVRALAENSKFEKVTLIGRRRLELPSSSEGANYNKIDQKIVDFEDLAKYAGDFEGYDMCFCALGTSSVGMTPEEYYHVTYDYVVQSAELAKSGGCKQFHLVSGRNAAKTSYFQWARTKAELEEKMAGMGFERLSIYRPGGIIKEKSDRTTLGNVGACALKVLDPFNTIFVESLIIGQAIVNNSFRVADAVEILEHKDIMQLAKKVTKQN